LIHQPLSDCDEPVTDHIPKGMEAGSPQCPGARRPGNTSALGALSGTVYPIVDDGFVDRWGHWEIAHEAAGRSVLM
jgi:hypothetical protein